MGDVARVVGVHCSTVSRVLGGKGSRGRIAPATQERIRQAARQLGYVAKPPVLLRRAVVELPVAELLRGGQTELPGGCQAVEPEPTVEAVPAPEPVLLRRSVVELPVAELLGGDCT